MIQTNKPTVVGGEWPFASIFAEYEHTNESSAAHQVSEEHMCIENYYVGNETSSGSESDSEKESESEPLDGRACEHQQFVSSVAKGRLFKGSALTTATSDVLILEYGLKHNLTNEALVDLLKLLQLHLPGQNNCTQSISSLKKLYSKSAFEFESLTKYYCAKCSAEVEVTSHVCFDSECQAQLNAEEICSFIVVPIVHQLKRILKVSQLFYVRACIIAIIFGRNIFGA